MIPAIPKSNFMAVLGLCVVLVFYAVPDVYAHRVVVFAWVEGGMVHTQSKFSGGKKVSGGEISALDMEGNLLLKGQTDKNGEFSFQAPAAVPMKILLKAGMGHQGEWLLTESDFGTGAGTDSTEFSMKTTPSKDQPVLKESYVNDPPQGVSAESIQEAVEKALDKKLQPVIHLLAESRDEGPSFSDIIGGIGYIIGLVGLAAFFNARRKDRGPS